MLRCLVSILPAACGLFAGSLSAAEPLQIEAVVVDGDALSTATFQSHNQKVVRNGRGIFMTHLRTRNEKFTAQQWRLSWSKDGGRTFETLYESTDATNPPTVETDFADNLYLGRPDYESRDVLLYRFLAKEDYRTPHITKTPNASAGKYAMCLDESRKQLSYLSHNGAFVQFGTDGEVRSSMKLLTKGNVAVSEYPLLNLASDGTLHAAWTSLKVDLRRYWGIHHMQSPDGGTSWRTFAGAACPVPVVVDETGPTDRITLDDEFTPSTWLSNFLVTNGKAHFLYLARTEPARQHYVRYDVASGKRELDVQPTLSGEHLSIHGLSGFFAAPPGGKSGTLYCVGHSRTRIVCLASDDDGTMWRDHAVSEPFKNPYAIGGFREITPDGWIIGSFSDVIGEAKIGAKSRVHFFRIPAASCVQP